MKRTFLDWKKPCIPTLVEHLLARHRTEGGDFYDLSEYVLVFPNRSASKRFLTVLADYAYQNHCTIEPPRVKQMGDFLELLYEQKCPCASLLTQQVVWMTALKEMYAQNPELLKTVFPNPPQNDDMLAWLNMGVELADIYQELVRENVDFTQVFSLCQQMMQAGTPEGVELSQENVFLNENENSTGNAGGDSAENELEDAAESRTPSLFFPVQEMKRWEFLSQLQTFYHAHIDELGLWDRQAARLFALRNEASSGPPSRDFQISFRLGIVGCVDLNNIHRAFLERVSPQVEIFVFAPESLQDSFEADGCLKSGKWKFMEPELNQKLHSVLVQSTTPEEQIQSAVEWLRGIAPRYAVEEITIGLADESLEPTLLQSLALAGVPTERAGKKVLSDLQPWKLLNQMKEYYESIAAVQPDAVLADLMETVGPTYETLAVILRHGDIGNYLRSLTHEDGSPLIFGDWLAELDSYFNQYFPDQMPSPAELEERHADFPALCTAYLEIHSMLEAFAKEYGNFHSMLMIVTQFLKKVYCWKTNYSSTDDAEYQIIRGCIDINHAFSDKFQLPQALLTDLKLTLPQALEILLSRMAPKQISNSSVPGTISIQRWLDLPLDDSEAMMVMGVNENFVPESVIEHIVLPNRLRSLLRVKTNENRFERDVYNLSAILASHQDVRVSFGRLSVDGDTLFPSRLLLTERSDAIISQVEAFFSEPQEPEKSGISEILEEKNKEIIENGKSAEDADFKGNVESEDGGEIFSRDETEIGDLFRTPPVPRTLPPIQEMSVTGFSTYLTNPYLYYLQNVLRLETVNDCSRELAAADFGTLVHDVMERFGLAEIARQKKLEAGETLTSVIPGKSIPETFIPETFISETDISSGKDVPSGMETFSGSETSLKAGKILKTGKESETGTPSEPLLEETKRIQNLLNVILNQVFAQRYKGSTLPVVSIQREQLRERLMVFAEKQALQYAAGWQIFCVEQPFRVCLRENGGCGKILLCGEEKTPSPMMLRGRLDRIDFRTKPDGTVEWRVWDYKTFNMTPEKKHFHSVKIPDELLPEKWYDLQLPLYRHLLCASRAQIQGQIQARNPETSGRLGDAEPRTETELRSEAEPLAEAGSLADPVLSRLATFRTVNLKVGYILLPKKVADIKFLEADWDEDVFRSAEECVRCVADAVHDGKFRNNGEVWEPDSEMDWILNPN